MPIYEYQCRKCGHDFEALQKVSDAPLKKCPECGALRLQRLVSAPQFRLKGTGWYETDFKKDGKRRLADGGDGKPAAEAVAEKSADSTTGKPDAADKKEKKKDKPEKKAAAAATD